MSDRLATEILRVVGRERGTVTILGTLQASGKVRVHNSTDIAVQFWVAKPATGGTVLVLVERGTAVGIGVTPA